jgi:hypothetical protein
MNSKRFIGQPHDFDFLCGTWHVENRRLCKRLASSNEWDQFPAVVHAWAMLGGMVSVDEVTFPTKGFSGLTFRSLDLAKREWSIYWINSANGQLLPPVRGGFDGDRGEFYGEDTDDARPVQVRFIWTRMGKDAANWEQAFSADGKLWETNWVMTMTRMSKARSDAGHDAREIAQRYIAVWNESDRNARRLQIAKLWCEDGEHFTPSMQAKGYEALERRITGAWDKWVCSSGHRFRACDDAVSHHGGVKFHWEMINPCGEVSSVGFDFLVLDKDARIRVDYQFIEPSAPKG